MTKRIDKNQFGKFYVGFVENQISKESSSYAHTRQKRYWYTFKVIENLIIKNEIESIIDIGPGDYHMGQIIKHFYPMIKYEGIEHPDAINNTISGDLYAAEFKTYSVNLEEPENRLQVKFDLALSMDCIEHLYLNPAQYLYNIYNLLNEDGLLLITTDNVSRVANILSLFFGKNIFFQLLTLWLFAIIGNIQK